MCQLQDDIVALPAIHDPMTIWKEMELRHRPCSPSSRLKIRDLPVHLKLLVFLLFSAHSSSYVLSSCIDASLIDTLAFLLTFVCLRWHLQILFTIGIGQFGNQPADVRRS